MLNVLYTVVVNGTPPRSYRVSLAIGNHSVTCYLPPDTSFDVYAFTNALTNAGAG